MTKKKPRKPYSMEFRDARYPITAKTLKEWKLQLEHGDKKKMVKTTKLSYSMIKRIFIEKRATLKQIVAIDHYFKFHAKR